MVALIGNSWIGNGNLVIYYYFGIKLLLMVEIDNICTNITQVKP